jgi:hypothetical protein
VANLCFNAEEDAVLETLFAAHTKSEPISIDSTPFRLLLEMPKKSIAERLSLIKRILANH